MGIFDDLLDLGKGIADATSDLVRDLGDIAHDAADEFISDPVKYASDSAKDIVDAGVHLVTLPVRPLTNAVEGVIDVCRDAVLPVRGSVVYTDLFFGFAEHSGIYVGNGRIIELAGSGRIQEVNCGGFTSGGTGVLIYVSCRNGRAVGSDAVAERAEKMLHRTRDYQFILDNCHQFTSGCLIGNFEGADNFLWMLKQRTENEFDANEWRVWER